LRENELSGLMLDWYDDNARQLPWRVPPLDGKQGKRAEPYFVWLSEVMLQQTTVAAVKGYFQKFTSRWPTVHALAAAEDAAVMAAWAGLGYYARARNLLKCARIVADQHQGSFPQTEAELIQLPGIGPYTAAAIAAIAFDRPSTVVDGNVERVMARMFDVATPLPSAKRALAKHAATLTPAKRPGDYAQAVMDIGATICSVKSPQCGICPWQHGCAAAANGVQEKRPVRLPKPKKPTRYGIAYVVRRSDGAMLLERRPDSGLLGGMLGWPGSDWSDYPQNNPPFVANWTQLSGEVRHTFTHFHLRLSVQVADVKHGINPHRGEFIAASELRPSDLPTLMRKVLVLSQKAAS